MNKRSNVFIKKEDDYNIYAASLGDKEHNEIVSFLSENPLPLSNEAKVKFNKQFKDLPEFNEIVSLGDPRDVSSELISSLIDHVHIDGQNSCKCFMVKDWDIKVNYRTEPMHLDNRSSWLCLIERLLSPNNIIIFKIKI